MPGPPNHTPQANRLFKYQRGCRLEQISPDLEPYRDYYIAIDPKNAQTLYLGGADKGLFKTSTAETS